MPSNRYHFAPEASGRGYAPEWSSIHCSSTPRPPRFPAPSACAASAACPPPRSPAFFLTSDNPAYLFEAFGLGTEKFELVFPLASSLVLHCSWQTNKKPGILSVPQKMVREINRRIACGADRFIFFHEERDWVLEAAKNKVSQVSRFQW
jgi:hypothetical protein